MTTPQAQLPRSGTRDWALALTARALGILPLVLQQIVGLLPVAEGLLHGPEALGVEAGLAQVGDRLLQAQPAQGVVGQGRGAGALGGQLVADRPVQELALGLLEALVEGLAHAVVK